MHDVGRKQLQKHFLQSTFNNYVLHFDNKIIMKSIFTCILTLLIFTASAQKYALVDRNFKNPILFTDSVTINQVTNNYFPIRVADIDTLNANLSFIIGQLSDIQRAKFKSYKLKSGNTIIQINAIAHANGDAYDILLITSVDNINAEYLLSSHKSLNKKAIKNIKSLLDFLKKDKEIIINEFKDFKPVLLDATVYISSKS